MKTKLISFIALLLISWGVKAQAQTLVLWHSDGTTTDVELFTQPNVLFKNNKVFVTSSVASLEYDEKDVVRFTYKGKSTGITSPSMDSNYSQENGQVVFHEIKSTDKIALYKTNGIRVPVCLVIHGNSATLPLSSIPSGIYLLCVNGRTSKFTKK